MSNAVARKPNFTASVARTAERCGSSISMSECRMIRRWLMRPTHLRFGLVKPEPHAHFPEHRHRNGEVVASLTPFAPAQVLRPEAVVATGDQRAQLDLLGESERFTVVAFRLFRGIAAGCDVAEKAQRARFAAALTAFAGKRRARSANLSASGSRPASTHASPRGTKKSDWPNRCPIASKTPSVCSNNGRPSAVRPRSE